MKAIKIILPSCFIYLLIFSSTKVAAIEHSNITNKTYFELADQIVNKEFQTLNQMLLNFTKKTEPHEAKILRKKIGATRSYIDIFAYAYHKEVDEVSLIGLRRLLDRGYETLGHYKDLWDSQGLVLAIKNPQTGEWSEGIKPDSIKYPKEQKEKLLKECLLWKKEFLNPKKIVSRRFFIHNISYSLIEHSKKKLSKFFWGGIDTIPNINHTGIENIRTLMAESLKIAQVSYDRIIREKYILDHVEDMEAFHDFRKRVRTVLQMDILFPALQQEVNFDAKEKTVLILMVERYGALNDLIVKYKHLRNREDKRKQLIKKINKIWNELRYWQIQNQIDHILERYQDRLSDF